MTKFSSKQLSVVVRAHHQNQSPNEQSQSRDDLQLDTFQAAIPRTDGGHIRVGVVGLLMLVEGNKSVHKNSLKIPFGAGVGSSNAGSSSGRGRDAR